VPDLAIPQGCHVYLWVTQKHLPTGLELFKKWGIKYQCLLTWVKPTGMTPYSWMYNTEHVLFGRIGTQKLEKLGVKLAFNAPGRQHSRKPDEFYDIVRQISPEPRVDLFAREPRPGFRVWGNETDYFEEVLAQ
jgi:N6-adenosine-specific RNA methylase IME4